MAAVKKTNTHFKFETIVAATSDITYKPSDIYPLVASNQLELIVIFPTHHLKDRTEVLSVLT
jgi:hypothetical protein